MDFLKNFKLDQLVNAALKWQYWPYAAGALALLLLVAVLVWVLRRKKKGPAGKTGSTALRASSTQDEHLPRSSLKRIWKKFLRQIPAQFRRAILVYQPFVVLGDPGVGKSRLIDIHTDWRGQANRFYPSYTAEPLLQIYLGSKALVMEIPSSLLNNTSAQVRDALVGLFKPLFKKRDPVVVVVLNGATLADELPENIRSQAQTMRGKINILSGLCKRPVKVCLALTHMDQVEGYGQLAAFFRQNDIPLHLAFSSTDDWKRIDSCLDLYEGYLPQALKSVSSGDYLKILSFFEAAPRMMAALTSFVKVLEASDPLSLEPQIGRLCFASRDGLDPEGSNPFTASITAWEVENLRPGRKHQMAAAGLLLLGSAYLVTVYYGERACLARAGRSLDIIEASPPDQYDTQIHKLFIDLTQEIEENPFLNLPPSFHRDVERSVRRRMVEDIRRAYLIPGFARLKSGEDPQERGIYLLGLIYATRHNELGRLIQSHMDDWQKTLSFSPVLIMDYINNNENVEDVTVDLKQASMSNPQGMTAVDDPLPWLVFFRKVDAALEAPYVTREYLQEIQKEADTYLKVVERMVRYRLTGELVGLLKRLTPVGAQVSWIQRRDAQLEQEGLREFLSYVKEKDITYPPTASLSLFELMENLKTMNKIRERRQESEYSFQFTSEPFTFKTGRWDDLILRSRITLFVREFMAQNRKTDGLLFFNASASYPDVVMNGSNDGLLYFVGKGKVDGRFTRSAFEQQVKPVLTELHDLLGKLPFDQDERGRFSSYILKQAEAYADRYVAAYRSYYSQFHMQSDSLGGLRYLLKQIQLPSSPFQDFLTSMKENTVLEVGDSPYLRQFAKKLGTFEFVRRLMAEKDGVYPELDKYKAILQQMDEEIDSTEPYTVKNKADEAGELKSLLSPVGRISLSIFLGENDCYTFMVRKWIKSVGIMPEWQQPFLEPVQAAFFLGKSDVESSVEKVWSGLDDSYVKPLYIKFPFDPKGEVEISPLELEKLVHPQGAFWKSFRSYLAPLCLETSGIWTVRVSPQGMFRIPDQMLGKANDMSRLAAALWNEKGIPKPLSFQVKPNVLPPREEHQPVPILSYLRCEKSSVFAFNQQPGWQKLEIEWWKPHAAAVGLEFEAFRDELKSYREITVSESFWGFFRLLSKAETSDTSLFVWRIEGSGAGSKRMKVEFSMKSDPWIVFH